MLRGVIFDLDDTLYEERQFVRGGFAEVARELERRGAGPADEAQRWLEHYHFAESRAGVFQKLAHRLGFPEAWIPELVALFRAHRPQLALAADAVEVLPRLRRRYRLGCVTDGWADVQRRKVAALGIEPYLDALVVADELGRDFWKPHARPFRECCALLGVEPAEALVVGDNPERDVAGARAAGLRSARIRRDGCYFAGAETEAPGLRADFEVRDLYALEELLARL
jgi:putative hydrolase of the HAD superfamily